MRPYGMRWDVRNSASRRSTLQATDTLIGFPAQASLPAMPVRAGFRSPAGP